MATVTCPCISLALAAIERRYRCWKHVIGPPAEHNGRRFEHLAPRIASFVAPTGKFSWANTAVLASDDDDPPEDVFYDSENDEYYDY